MVGNNMVSNELKTIIDFLEGVKEISKTQTLEEQQNQLEKNAQLMRLPKDVKCESIRV